MTKKIFQIQIALKRFRPKIWRRILIPSDLLLPDFHLMIQITMGWKNSHLHQFVKNRTFYTLGPQDDDYLDEMHNEDYKKTKVSDLLTKEEEKIVYEYDFGDCWEHDIVLEKIRPVDNRLKYPICLAGEMRCPPEDCGGVWGYAQMLETLIDPENEDYERYIEWLGEEFDPEYFNEHEINRLFGH